MEFFSQQNNTLTPDAINQILNSLQEFPDFLKYDQYVFYHYKNGYTHKAFYLDRIRKLISAQTGDWIFFYELTVAGPYLIGIRLSKWDEDHFGFKMANLQIFSAPADGNSKKTLKLILEKALFYIKKQGAQYISSRINGDHISALHAMEDCGFRYYDNVVWPVVSVKHVQDNTTVRLIRPEDISEVKRIAEEFQYKRGHYYCDERFNNKTINAMYPKWIDTTIKNNEPIAVLEREGNVAGFFVFKMDDELKNHTGYNYARLRLLALDSAYRGTGAGSELFKGTLSLAKSMGAEFIDSGYSTKNHISAGLHVKSSFLSVYEEVTFHLWLS